MILYTIGYRGATRTRLIEVLAEHGITAVLDCRESATGIEEFREDALRDALCDAGIYYRHCDEWGNPFRPPRYTGTDALTRFEERARRGRWGDEVCATVEEITDGDVDEAGEPDLDTVCLLCACKDANQCHRGVLARLAVEASGGALEVRHLSPAAPREVQGGLFGDVTAQAEEEGH